MPKWARVLVHRQELGLDLEQVRVLVHKQELSLDLELVRGLVHKQELGLDLELVQDLVYRPGLSLDLEQIPALAHKQELGLELPGLERKVQPSKADSMLWKQWFPLRIVPEPVDSAVPVEARRSTMYLLPSLYSSLKKTLKLEDHFPGDDTVGTGLAEQH